MNGFLLRDIKKCLTSLKANMKYGAGVRERHTVDPSQGFQVAADATGAGVAAVPPPPLPDEGGPNTSLPTFSPASLLLSISTTKHVLEPSHLPCVYTAP
jgi:hypothetical protein